ncbi:hypothetical protein Tco_1205514 [Tanacetum coccineum]
MKSFLVKVFPDTSSTTSIKQALQRRFGIMWRCSCKDLTAWRPTRKVVGSVKPQWKPTGRHFALYDNCPLTRIMEPIVEPLELTPSVSSSSKVTMISRFTDCKLSDRKAGSKGLSGAVFILYGIRTSHVSKIKWRVVLLQSKRLTVYKAQGETIHDYYVPEWGRFVTAVKLNRGLRDSNYDQLYAYLKQYEAHANENKMLLD